ncbi:MAG: sensor histidine kinase [Sporichthyaceae bacterium]
MATLLILTTAAVAITGSAATAVMRSYLVDRVDGVLERQTNSAMPFMTQDVDPAKPDAVSTGTSERTVAPQATATRLPSAYLFITRDADGVELRRENAQFDPVGAAPQLMPVTLAQAQARAGEPFEIAAVDRKQAPWRALLTPLPDGSGSLMVAVNLSEVQTTVGRLGRILFAVGVGVLILMALLAYGMVRTSLRPLREVEATARAIAAGDLTRRVPEHPARTEVGQLSAAVNVMLVRVESAVNEREAAAENARRSEERMRRFVTDASHELRTPLTSIRGFAELYRQGASAPEQVPTLLRRIEDEATRMGLLVEDLLLLARLDQQRPLQREPVDLVAVATDTVHAARAANPGRTLTVEEVAADDPPVVIGDSGRLRQVIANLVNNACVHTPADTPITVRVGSLRDAGGPWAVLEVIDRGAGLSAADCQRVFERFYRADSSRARTTGGSGLGLSIVAALVAAHRGEVTVGDTPGGGATFRVLLPAVADPAPTETARPEHAHF